MVNRYSHTFVIVWICFSNKTNFQKVIRRLQRHEMIIFWLWFQLMQLYANSSSMTNQNWSMYVLP